jgi:NtrC-family two-component system sensor histidine kinase KinB
MSLKTRILIGYGAILLIIGLVVLWAVVHIVELGKASEAILSENYRSIHAAENMINLLEQQERGLLLIVLGEKTTGRVLVHENGEQFRQWLERAADNITVKGERELLAEISSRAGRARERFMVFSDDPEPAQTVRYSRYQTELLPELEGLRAQCSELRRINENTMVAASREAHRLAGRAFWSTTLVMIIAILLALVFSFFLADRIVQPVRRFMEASRRVSCGDFAVQVPENTEDELGALGIEFNRMVNQLGRYHEMNIDKVIMEKNKGEAILTSIEDALIVLDTGLVVTAVNPAARDLLRLAAPGDEGVPIEEVLPDAELVTRIRKTIHDGVPPGPSDEQRILSLQSAGEIRYYLTSVTAVRGRNRELTGVVLMLRDITRLKEVERMKSEFVMAASHELRTPLTGLSMSVELLTESLAGKLPERERDLLKAARDEVHRMNSLVDDLLSLSRLEAGRIEMDFEMVPVATVLEHAVSVFRNQTEMKGISLVCEFPVEPMEVRLDANKIAWVLTNLISNALRYVGAGGRVVLSAGGSSSHAWFSVLDDGPGIPKEYQGRIFQKFIQVKGQEGGGSGLGLAICKEIVRAHGGTIWVESEPGKGSEFRFQLPKG